MAGAASEVYEPLNQYKTVARNIGIVDGPLEYLTTAGVRLPVPFTTRMTVVRLGNGEQLQVVALEHQALVLRADRVESPRCQREAEPRERLGSRIEVADEDDGVVDAENVRSHGLFPR